MSDPRLCPCGSGKPKFPCFDARDIFLCYACDDCAKAKLAKYRPEVLSDPNYDLGTDKVDDDE